MTSTHIINTN